MTWIAISRLSAACQVGCGAVYMSVVALAGCAAMAGVGGSAEFGCKAPVGVKCDSVSGTYYNALQQNLPSQQKGAPPEARTAPSLLDQFVEKTAAPTPYSTQGAPVTRASALTPEADAPLRSPPRVLRLWIKPWEDGEGDFHSQSYVYIPIDTGRWLVDHYGPPSHEAYTPIKAPRAMKRANKTGNSAVTAGSSRSGDDGSLLTGSGAAAFVRPTGGGSSDGQ